MAGTRWILLGICCLCFAATATAGAVDHEFHYKAPDASSVQLMGEFNGWKGQAMSKGGDGVWTTTVSLSPGSHAYKFLVNGKDWVYDPDNPSRTKADGIENSSVEIGAEATPSSSPAVGGRQPEVGAAGSSTSASASMSMSTMTPAASAEISFTPTPGGVATVEVPLSPARYAEMMRDKEPNPKLHHARVGFAVPQGFDPAKSWPVLVVSNTETYSNIDALNQFKDAALSENWVVMAADEVEADKNKEGSQKWPCLAAGLDYLTKAWPGLKKWPMACGGMSGGAKNSSFLAGDLAREGHKVIGLLLMGCNQDMATVAFRKGGAATMLGASVFISSGKSDTIATPDSALAVKNSVQATGFRKVRLESFDGAHDVYQPHVTEALRWFLAQSSPTSATSGSSPSDFDKFFKKK